MKKKLLCPIFAFIAVVLFHAAYLIWDSIQLSKQWIQIDSITPLTLYFERQDYFIGVSYGLAGAFTVYAFMKFHDSLKSSTAGMVGGITLTVVLYFAGCFLVGCCGSPMLVVYMSLFGSSFMHFAKPVMLLVTVVSVSIGFLWMERKTKATPPCCANKNIDGCKNHAEPKTN